MISLSFPYAKEPFPPFWGLPNSNRNFCEEDYAVTTYIAEFINTLTNSIYVIYGLHGIYRLCQQNFRMVHLVPYIGLVGVGICSAWYHCTLKYHSQMADDLSMFLATAPILTRLLCFASPENSTSLTTATYTALILISTIHVVYDETILHATTFCAMICFIGHNTYHLIHDRVPDVQARRQVQRTARLGIAFAVTGYAVWLADRYCCDALTVWKRRVGMPWAFVFEFHGWWHIFTGISSFTFIVLTEYLVSEGLGTKTSSLEDMLAWPASGWACTGNGSGTNDSSNSGTSVQDGAANGKVKMHSR